jgi:hypothetical protein
LQFGIWAPFLRFGNLLRKFPDRKKPGFPLQVLGFAYANPAGFPLQSLAHPGASRILNRISQVYEICRTIAANSAVFYIEAVSEAALEETKGL